MQSSRIRLYEEKIQALNLAKENGAYTDTSESFERDLNKLDTKLSPIKEVKASIQHFDYYYQFIIKKNHVYEIVEAR